VDLGVDGEHHGRVIRGGIRVREAPAQRASIPDLRIADFRRGIGDGRTFLAQQRGRSHVVMHRARPDLDLPSFSRMPDRPGILAMSISACGSLRRSFMSGTRLWPPAMSLAPPPAAFNFATASSSDVARAYSNAVGITPGLRG
jgi:hypothetical protein